MGATATCRWSTRAGSWALFPASISAASNWIAWTKKPVCGGGSDARNQRTTTAELKARLCAEPQSTRSSPVDDVTLARALHVLAVVLWIGGVAFVTTVLLPAVRDLHAAADRVIFFETVERRFGNQARVTTVLAG